VRSCELCKTELDGFRSALQELRSEAAAGTLTGFEAISNWSRIKREMLGNIVVGVAAARCIDNVGRKRRFWPALGIAAGLTVLFAAGWASHIPSDQTHRIWSVLWQVPRANALRQSGSVVQTTPLGIAVKSQGVTLTMMHPRTALLSVSGASGVEARFIDEDSGQVTITDVYGQ
jgi:hypothetical protein